MFFNNFVFVSEVHEVFPFRKGTHNLILMPTVSTDTTSPPDQSRVYRYFDYPVQRRQAGIRTMVGRGHNSTVHLRGKPQLSRDLWTGTEVLRQSLDSDTKGHPRPGRIVERRDFAGSSVVEPERGKRNPSFPLRTLCRIVEVRRRTFPRKRQGSHSRKKRNNTKSGLTGGLKSHCCFLHQP